jgi:hypothetical protein
MTEASLVEPPSERSGRGLISPKLVGLANRQARPAVSEYLDTSISAWCR